MVGNFVLTKILCRTYEESSFQNDLQREIFIMSFPFSEMVVIQSMKMFWIPTVRYSKHLLMTYFGISSKFHPLQRDCVKDFSVSLSKNLAVIL